MSEDHNDVTYGDLIAGELTASEEAESLKCNTLLVDLEKSFHHLFFPEGAPKRGNH